jgi:F5/8 type C domain
MKKWLLLFWLINLSPLFSLPYESKIVYYPDGKGGGINGRLRYVSDLEGNHIPDFSHAGYHEGKDPVPQVPVSITLTPLSGDSTALIQNALDQVSSPGAVLLRPGGYYDVSDVIKMNRSGIVLRGIIDPKHPHDPAYTTIIRSTAVFEPNRPSKLRTVIMAGGGKFTPAWPQNSDTANFPRTNIVTPVVPLGARSFEVEDASVLQAGDNIIIVHPATQNWINAVNKGGVVNSFPWLPATANDPAESFFFNRFIKEIKDNVITIDTPLFNTLNKTLSQSFIYKFDRENICTEIGIENLKIITNKGNKLGAWNSIGLCQIENSWVSNVIADQFVESGFFTTNASYITFKQCRASTSIGDPLQSGSCLNFNTSFASNNLLFDRCHSENARNAFTSYGTASVSGIAFVKCTSVGDYLESGSHRRWSMGLLYDSLVCTQPNNPFTNGKLPNDVIKIGLYNRGDHGNSNGWSAVNSVVWGSKVAFNQPDMAGNKVKQKIVIQKPPTAQNFGIGCTGNVTGSGYYTATIGYIEKSNGTLRPASLYQAQLTERLTYGDAPSPAYISAVTAIANGLTITWLPTLDVPVEDLQYVLERWSPEEKKYTTLATLPGSKTSYTDKRVAGAQYYRILSKNLSNGNWSAYSNIFLKKTYRYVRLYVPPNQSYKSVDLYKIAVKQVGSDSNIALKKPTIASSHISDDFESCNAVDGAKSTMWSALNDSNEQWLVIDLKEPCLLREISLVVGKGFPAKFEIQVSQDNVTFEPFVA